MGGFRFYRNLGGAGFFRREPNQGRSPVLEKEAASILSPYVQRGFHSFADGSKMNCCIQREQELILLPVEG